MNNKATTLSLWLMLLMAFAIGIAVASNYYAQPLLYSITQDLHISIEQSGLIVTTAQFSYAFGLLFVSPLGDKVERKRLIIILMFLTIAGLLICGFSNSFMMLLVGTALAGVASAVAQILIPLATVLADPGHRGKVVGFLMSGMLLGILLARTFAGAISSWFDWRMVYLIAAALMLLVSLLLMKSLPKQTAGNSINYWQLISSIVGLYRVERILRIRSLLGGIGFGLLSLLWTPLAFLLSTDPYHFSDFIIGIFGLAGALGVLGAPIVGRLSDKGKGRLATSIGISLLLFSWLPLAFAQYSIVALIIGILLIDLAVQVVHVSCLNALYQIRPEMRSRMNAGYMVCFFIGGMLGSMSSTYLFSHYGWLAIVVVGTGLAIIAFGIWGYDIKTRRLQC